MKFRARPDSRYPDFMRLLRRLRVPTPASASASEEKRTVVVGSTSVDLVIRHHPTARRMKLALDPAVGQPVLTLPLGVPDRDGLAFLAMHEAWLLERLAELPQGIVFEDQATFPLEGQIVTILHRPDARNGVRLEDDVLWVSGEEGHLPRRVTDFLRERARQRIKPLARDKAAALNRKAGRISVRDQRSRWGSCASSGNLSFSWRLILAPPDILDYVVAHEAAHLVHMDHSSAFWQTVARIHNDVDGSRAWLAENGAALHRVG